MKRLILSDDNNNFYGIMEFETDYTLEVIKTIYENTIVDLFGNSNNFFDEFSSNICKVTDKLNELGYKCYIKYDMNSDIVNLDRVFNNVDEIKNQIGEFDKTDIKAVVCAISDMLVNNIEFKDYIGESLINWCENGDSFNNGLISNISVERRIKIMKFLNSYVDDLTSVLYDLLDSLD